MSHSTPDNKDLDFVDVSIEKFREYETPNGIYRIENPIALAVKPSGSHRVLSYDGEKYVSHYVPADGRRPLRWAVEPGEKFFIGWGETAVENTGVSEQVEF